MKRILRKSAIIASALTALMVLSACGGGGGGGRSPATTDAVTGSKDTRAPGKFPADSTMANIQRRGQLVVGMVENEAPFSSQNPNTGTWEGFDVEIAKQVAVAIFGSQIEGKIRWIPVDPRDRELALEQGRVDIAMGRYAITIPRKRFVDFAGPYYIAYQQAVVVNNNRDTSGLIDLNGESVCLVQGSSNFEAAKATIPGADFSTVKNTVQECAAALTGGEVEGIIADHVDLLPIISGGSRRVSVLPTTFGQEPYGIGVKRGLTDFRQLINDELEQNVSENYATLYRRAIPGDRQTPALPPLDRY